MEPLQKIEISRCTIGKSIASLPIEKQGLLKHRQARNPPPPCKTFNQIAKNEKLLFYFLPYLYLWQRRKLMRSTSRYDKDGEQKKCLTILELLFCTFAGLFGFNSV